MLTRYTSLAVAAAALLGETAEAKTKTKVVKTADGRKTRQEVELGSNDDLCIFENDDDKWCFSVTPPMMKGGWRWTQAYTETDPADGEIIEYYQIKLEPFLTT